MKVNVKALAGLIGLTIAASGTAYAQRAPQQQQQSMGWYLGASLGQSEQRATCTGVANCDEKDAAWRLLAGYQFTPHFAAELGYHNFGEASAPGASIKANAWEGVVVGSFPIGPVSLYGKLGFFRGELDGLGITETNQDVTYGVGVQYNFSRQVGVRGEWQRYNNLGGGRFGSETDVDVLSVGVVYRFQ